MVNITIITIYYPFYPHLKTIFLPDISPWRVCTRIFYKIYSNIKVININRLRSKHRWIRRPFSSMLRTTLHLSRLTSGLLIALYPVLITNIWVLDRRVYLPSRKDIFLHRLFGVGIFRTSGSYLFNFDFESYSKSSRHMKTVTI